uniref:Uncharacterized protein n=1 Tax=Fagus sylvatica TaxID=28930 RepID=A0A2N9GGN5_FAGSY
MPICFNRRGINRSAASASTGAESAESASTEGKGANRWPWTVDRWPWRREGDDLLQHGVAEPFRNFRSLSLSLFRMVIG